MKDKRYLFNIISVTIIVVAIFFLNVFFINKEDISVAENRKLADMPIFSMQALKSGQYFAGLDSYVSDNFFGRDSLVNQNRKFKNLIHTNIFASPNSVSIITPSNPGEGNAIAIKNENVFFIIKHNFDIVKQYCDVINRYQATLKNANINVLVSPTIYEFINDRKLKENVTPQSEVLEYAKNCFDAGVNYTDVYNSLSRHKNEYIFFKSDHHWTSLGPYYAYREFATAQGKTPISLNDSTLKDMGEFTGTFYNYTNDERVNKIKDNITIYTPNVKYDCFYDYEMSGNLKKLDSYFDISNINYKIFLGGDFGFVKIKTEIKNGGTLMILKDSYANALMQFLIEHYSKIIIIDPRYFKEKVVDIVKSEEVDSILFINNIETLSDINFINNLTRIL